MEYNEIDAIEGDVYGNTEIRELPDDPQNIPQGVKPHLNPNPGYGEDGKTVSAIKTDLLEGERGVVAEKNTDQRGIKVVREPHNFTGGIFVNGKEIKTEASPDKYGLEIIEWDGERTFTQEEIQKLRDLKACVKNNVGFIYYVIVHETVYLTLNYFYCADDGIENGYCNSLYIHSNGTFDLYEYSFDELRGTKLYKHKVSLSTEDDYYLILISSRDTAYNTIQQLIDELIQNGVNVYHTADSDGEYGTVMFMYKTGTTLEINAYSSTDLTINHYQYKEGIVNDIVTEL